MLGVLAGTCVVVGSPPAAAAPAVFDPVGSVVAGPQTAFGRVVTNGRGTFLAVARQNTVPQVIVVKRSTDGGTTWSTAGMFDGDDGGATRPWLAIDGDRAAVTYIGSFCDRSISPAVCEEAPYMVTSTDAGATWNRPIRVDNQAFEARVAVDSTRTWVVWERTGGIELRGVGADGRTLVARQHFDGSMPHLAAGDGLMMMAWSRWLSDGPSVQTVVADGAVLRAPSMVANRSLGLGHWESSVAVAGGVAHVLLADRSAGTSESPFFVATAGRNGVLAAPVAAGAGSTGAFAAADGTVAVAVAAHGGITRVASSSDRGGTFSAPTIVSATGAADEDAPLVELGVVEPDPARPRARFGWTVPDRFVDGDGDGLPDPANASGNATLDQLRVYANQAMTVTLDGCGSVPGTGQTMASYTWLVDGDLQAAGSCRNTITVDDGTAPTVRLIVENSAGEQATVEQVVAPADHVIVSIGDSVASGEGNPHASGGWRDTPCHRSGLAGPALAAAALEGADKHSSVTFIQLACSGAAIVDTPEVAGVDDPDTGGLLDAYHGVSPTAGSLRPSQMTQLAELVGARHVDALLVSIGANDVRFKDVLLGCFTTSRCDASPVRTEFESRLAELPARYGRLAAAIAGQGIAAGNVHITEYFDPTIDSRGVVTMRCPSALAGLLDDDEAQWAHTGVIGGLNAAASDAASANGWRYVGGIAAAYDRHGYCADDNWVVTAPESLLDQGDPYGTFHPNNAGQRVYGDRLLADLQATLLAPPVSTATSPNPGGAGELGDVMVIAATRTEVTSAAVATGSGSPVAGVVRRLDRLISGDGFVSSSGPPAVDQAVAVGAWHQLSGVGAFDTTVRLTTLAVRPNVAVRHVDIVQAPADSRTIVAGRDTLVQATIDAYLAAPTSIAISTTVESIDSGGVRSEVVPETVEQVTLRPGRNVVLLPRGSAFTIADDLRVAATVEVSDPPGASPSDSVDDVFQTSYDRSARETRPLRVMVGNAYVGPSSVSCADTRGAAERMVAFAEAAMPVSQGIDVDLFCDFNTTPEQSKPGVLEELAWLDELARYLGIDALVVVVPPGWLRGALDDAVGAAAAGLRAAIVESNAGASTLAHELAHVFGLGHNTRPIPASGALVSRRMNRAGIDWMDEISQPKPWTGGATWDRLAVAIGDASFAPERLDPNGPQVWVRGTVQRDSNGDWYLTPGRLQPAAATAGAVTVPGGSGSIDAFDRDLDELEVERLTVQQVDDSGNPLGPLEPVPMGEAGGLYAPGATVPTQPIGFGFATLLPLQPGAAAFEYALDGVPIASVPISPNPPTVTLDAPAGGGYVPRGTDLTVAWTGADVDGDPLSAVVMISDDDGVTWQPFADAGSSASITRPVPQDVGGDQVRVKVVVTDGVWFAEAVSPAFSAEADPSLGTERLVFTRSIRQFEGDRIMTADPDGTDVSLVIGPAFNETIQNWVFCGPTECPTYFREPVWANHGDEIIFSSNLLRQSVEGDTTVIGNWAGGFRLWSVHADGTGLTRITPQANDTSYYPADQFGTSLGNGAQVCPAVSRDGSKLVWLTATGSYGTIGTYMWLATRTATGWSNPTVLFAGGSQPNLVLHPSFPALTGEPAVYPGYDQSGNNPSSCPRFAPDGNSVVFVAGLSYPFVDEGTQRTRFDDGAVIQVAIDGSPARVISPVPPYFTPTGPYSNFRWQLEWNRSVDWPASGNPIVSRGFSVDPAFWVSQGIVPSPEVFGVFSLDPATGVFTRLTPTPDVDYNTRPTLLETSPSGVPYGVDFAPQTCGWGRQALGVIDTATGGVDIVTPDNPDGLCPVTDGWFDWGIVRGAGGGTALPLVEEPDPEQAPPPGPDPEVVDVTEPIPTDDVPLDGADEVPVSSPSPAVDVGPIQVAGDVPSVITLAAADGLPAVFQVVSPPSPDALTVEGEIDPTSSDAGGRFMVRPVPGFRGTVSFTVVVRGSEAAPATVTIEVVGNRSPIANPDSITAIAGSEAILDESVLLGNDVDPDDALSGRLGEAVDALQLASVYGSGGAAWIDAAGALHLAPATAGRTTFSYVVVDPDGATAVGTVTLDVTQQVGPTNPTTTTPATNPTTAPTTVAPTTPQVPTTTPSAAPTTTVRPATQLPRTGNESFSTLQLAVACAVIGGGLLLLARRTS